MVNTTAQTTSKTLEEIKSISPEYLEILTQSVFVDGLINISILVLCIGCWILTEYIRRILKEKLRKSNNSISNQDETIGIYILIASIFLCIFSIIALVSFFTGLSMVLNSEAIAIKSLISC